MREQPSPEYHHTRRDHLDHSAAMLRHAQARIAELEARLADAQQREAHANQRIAALEAQITSGGDAGNSVADARLNVLLAIGAALLVTHEIEPVLDLIIREATTLFPGTDGALLMLEDPQDRELIVRVAHQHQQTDMGLPIADDMTDYTFMAPRAMLLDSSRLAALLHKLHPDIHQLLTEQIAPWPPTSALLAPLRDEHRCMGALLLYRNTVETTYQPYDLPFIQTLADLAAVAITETYQRARAAALQRDLAHIQYLHREAQARLDAAQAQLLQSAKLAAIGELSASVAHEINNPLYAARNSLYLIEQDLPPDSDQQRFLEIAQGELGRIARIITRMRDFYRPSRAEFTDTDVNSLLSDTVEFVQTYLRHSQIRVKTDFTPDLPVITAHIDQLRQVFLNIVLNACDAMSSGGSLTIATSHETESPDQSPGITVHIADTGTGIAPEHMEHLFEPFYTTKPQGTGLGLAISAHIVTQHAGRIAVDSAENIGTTFIITLPVNGQPGQPE
jgi:two-component system NtrC family sensor kinase